MCMSKPTSKDIFVSVSFSFLNSSFFLTAAYYFRWKQLVITKSLKNNGIFKT